MNYGGCVAACGTAGRFALTRPPIMPFILRNVRVCRGGLGDDYRRRAEAQARLVRICRNRLCSGRHRSYAGGCAETADHHQ